MIDQKPQTLEIIPDTRHRSSSYVGSNQHLESGPLGTGAQDSVGSFHDLDQQFNQERKTKIYTQDPNNINEHLIFSNPDLDELDIDVILQNESKLLETEYKPREWAQSKLAKIKGSSSLGEQITVVKETVNVKGNAIHLDLHTPSGKTTNLEILFFTNGIFKLKCLNPENPSKFSFELIEKPANLTELSIADSVKTEDDSLEVNLAEAQVRVLFKFNPFNVVVYSTKNQDQIVFEMNSNTSLKFDSNLSGDFRFHSAFVYGIPEHAHDLLLENTKEGHPYRLFNNDLFGYPTASREALYGTVPIMVARSLESPTFAGVFWENTSETYVDIHRNESTSDTYWLSERGNLECYIFVNHSVKDHYTSITNLTGNAPMPNYFTLGYHQCRYSYNDEQDLLHVNEKFNEHEIPCDSVTLDIDHTDGFRYLTWDREMFPDPVNMQDIIARDGRKLIAICDPHIKVDENYPVYAGAMAKKLCVQTPEGKPFVGVCFPGHTIWMDFMNEEARDFWSSRYSYENYKLSTPILFAWNDMNEPSVFAQKDKAMPRENLHTIKSLAEPEKAFKVEHREVHNIYGYCMHKGTFNGLLRRNKDQNIRPHVLSRAFYAGSQKWATIWTGDTLSTWEHLKYTIPMMLSMGLCGISSIGGDVGGFLGNPEPELNVRWHQLGEFMPFFRAHCDKRYDRREPWLISQTVYEIVKDTIKSKYRFLPYWYNTFELYSRTGLPLLRPIWLDLDKVTDPEVMKDDGRFIVGEDLLVSPIFEFGQYEVKNPLKGLNGRWYEYHTKKEIKAGEDVKTGIERIGVFFRGGSIIPQYEVKNNMKSSISVREGNIYLLISLDENESAKGRYYIDDGETFNFKKGDFTEKTIEFSKDTLSWIDTGKNGFNVVNNVTRVVLMGLNKKVSGAQFSDEGANQKVEVTNEEGWVQLDFTVPAKGGWKLTLSF